MMAEMTVAEASETLFKSVFLANDERVRIAAMLESQAAEIERLKVCGNCRHFSVGYSGDYCVKIMSHGGKETKRTDTCGDWEMN